MTSNTMGAKTTIFWDNLDRITSKKYSDNKKCLERLKKRCAELHDMYLLFLEELESLNRVDFPDDASYQITLTVRTQNLIHTEQEAFKLLGIFAEDKAACQHDTSALKELELLTTAFFKQMHLPDADALLNLLFNKAATIESRVKACELSTMFEEIDATVDLLDAKLDVADVRTWVGAFNALQVGYLEIVGSAELLLTNCTEFKPLLIEEKLRRNHGIDLFTMEVTKGTKNIYALNKKYFWQKPASKEQTGQIISVLLAKLRIAATEDSGKSSLSCYTVYCLAKAGIAKSDVEILANKFCTPKEKLEQLTPELLIQATRFIKRYGSQKDIAALADLPWYKSTGWVFKQTIKQISKYPLPVVLPERLQDMLGSKGYSWFWDRNKQVSLSENVEAELIIANRLALTVRKSLLVVNAQPIKGIDGKEYPFIGHLEKIQNHLDVFKQFIYTRLQAWNGKKSRYFSWLYRGSNAAITKWQLQMLETNFTLLKMSKDYLVQLISEYRKWSHLISIEGLEDGEERRAIVLRQIKLFAAFLKRDLIMLKAALANSSDIQRLLSTEETNFISVANIQTLIADLQQEEDKAVYPNTYNVIQISGIQHVVADVNAERVMQTCRENFALLATGSVIPKDALALIATKHRCLTTEARAMLVIKRKEAHKQMFVHLSSYLTVAAGETFSEYVRTYIKQLINYLCGFQDSALLASGLKILQHHLTGIEFADDIQFLQERVRELKFKMADIEESDAIHRPNTLQNYVASLTELHIALSNLPDNVVQRFNTLVAKMIEAENPSYQENKHRIWDWDAVEVIMQGQETTMLELIELSEKTAKCGIAVVKEHGTLDLPALQGTAESCRHTTPSAAALLGCLGSDVGVVAAKKGFFATHDRKASIVIPDYKP